MRRGVLLLGVGQLVDHVREDEQTLVDVGCFLGVLLKDPKSSVNISYLEIYN